MRAIRMALGCGLALGLAACTTSSPVARGTTPAPLGLDAPAEVVVRRPAPSAKSAAQPPAKSEIAERLLQSVQMSL